MLDKLYLKHVARGKKGSRHLTFEEAVEVGHAMARGEATEAQIAGFLIAERMKSETAEELRGIAETFRSYCQPFDAPSVQGCDVVGPFDGRTHSFLASIASSFVMASVGIPTLIHSSQHALPPKQGITAAQVLSQMGASLDESYDQPEIFHTTKFGCINPEDFCPPLQSLRPIRDQLEVRTILNTVEKVVNPARNPHIITGVFHKPQIHTVSQLLHDLGYQKAMIAQGTEGSEDLPTHRPSIISIVNHGVIREFRIDPRTYHLRAASNIHETLTASDQAEILLQVLLGTPVQPYYDLVVWNSAIRLWFLGHVKTIAEGITLAIQSLRTQRAFRVWSYFEQHTQGTELEQTL